jgi:hypothetical protein
MPALTRPACSGHYPQVLLAEGTRPVVSDRHGRPGGTLTPVTRFAAARLDPRPPGDGCQGGDRTPAFRVTAGRLSARPPGIAYRDGESNPALRVEGPVSWPLDHRGEKRKRGDSNAQGLAPLPVFGTGSSSSRVTSMVGPSAGVAPTASSLPRTRSGSLSYKGMASPARLERATPAFGGRCSRPAELRRAARRRQGSNLHPPVS